MRAKDPIFRPDKFSFRLKNIGETEGRVRHSDLSAFNDTQNPVLDMEFFLYMDDLFL